MEFIVVSEQLTYILYSLVFGFFSAALYFCIKILRLAVGVTAVENAEIGFLKFTNKLKIKSFGKAGVLRDIIFIHLLDILYLILVSLSFCIFAFYFNHGRLRWYLLFAVILGFLAFYHSAGRLIMYLSKYIVCVIKSFTNLIVYGIIKCIEFMIKPVDLLLNLIKIRINYRLELRKLNKYICAKGESNGT